MNTEEARNYVEAGLRKRSVLRQEREKELEAFEAEMISYCNKHSADIRKTMAEKEKSEMLRTVKAEKRAAMRKKDELAEMACTKYGYACVAILLTCCITPLPFYGAAALIAGLAVFPTVYILKLYELV
jgi:hypothetical protein